MFLYYFSGEGASQSCLALSLFRPFTYLCLTVELIQLSRREVKKGIISAHHAHLHILRQSHYLEGESPDPASGEQGSSVSNCFRRVLPGECFRAIAPLATASSALR